MIALRVILFAALGVTFLAGAAPPANGKATPPLKVSEMTRIAIPKAGLGKEYLLSTSIIPQAGAPTSRGMVGRVVSFELFEDGVDMYESTRGQVVTEDLPARRLLATFPIVSETGSQVVIDFNQGMRRLAYNSWVQQRPGFDPGLLERSAELPQARVFEARAENGVLAIRQAVQARSRSMDPDLEVRYELRYFISPYAPGDFESREMPSEEERYARFFATPKQLELESGRVSSKMSLFDLSEPVVFHYSANTPETMVEAIREGILYWNKAYGKEVVQARPAPEGVSAPDPQYNVVQWVPWDNAGFAYADLLLDPLTGKAMRGQAYMTSVFDFSGQVRARALLRSLRAMIGAQGKADGDASEQRGAGIRYAHMGSHVNCLLDPVEFAIELSEGLEEMLADPKLTEEAVLRISQDYVRLVAAHEVGHVLGLRHNFAGSLAATMSPAELDQFFADYIGGKDLSAYEEKSATSSVMEYSAFKAAVFAGWQLARRDAALEHDAGALRWGYFDDKTVVEEKLLFASDEETSRFGDANRFDYGADPLLAQYNELSSAIRFLPNTLIERFIEARAPMDPRDRKSLEAVPLSVQEFAARLAEPVGGMLKWFRKDTRSLRVENDFASISDLNEEERWKAHWDYLNAQLGRLGGVDRIAFAHLPVDLSLDLKVDPEGVEPAPKIDAEKMESRLKELLDSEAYASFVGLDGETYAWTDDEKQTIIKRGKALFSKLEEATLAKTLALYENAPRDLGLAATGKLADDDSVAQLEKRIVDLAKAVLLARDKEERIRGKVDKAFVEVPDFVYGYETREAAAKALNDKTGSFEAWAKEAKQELHAELKKAVEESLNIGHFKKFDDALLSRSLREWYLREQNLLKLLPPAPNNGNGNGK